MTSINDLQRGDHVSFRSKFSNNHAIVECVNHGDENVMVIEPGQYHSKKLNFKDKNFRKYLHRNRPCPETVIERAHSMEGKQEYEQFGGNSERFANWCMEDEQVQNLRKSQNNAKTMSNKILF